VAEDIPGCRLIRNFPNAPEIYTINEIEIYRGEEDEACHARRGKTPRTEVMYEEGGLLYVYLIYGMHWMMNIVTGEKDNPQAILIRGLKEIKGPGRITKSIQIDGTFNREDLVESEFIWLERGPQKDKKLIKKPRIGIDYAGEYYRNIHWRYMLSE
jgi:DNA-3-methyladenine glycosylase